MKQREFKDTSCWKPWSASSWLSNNCTIDVSEFASLEWLCTTNKNNVVVFLLYKRDELSFSNLRQGGPRTPGVPIHIIHVGYDLDFCGLGLLFFYLNLWISKTTCKPWSNVYGSQGWSKWNAWVWTYYLLHLNQAFNHSTSLLSMKCCLLWTLTSNRYERLFHMSTIYLVNHVDHLWLR